MATSAHIRGLLLEEVLLFLLETSGYKPVDPATISTSDPLLRLGSAGIELQGRGAYHQIDAIADYKIPHPFSHPQRLLVEAKCYARGTRVGIDVIRNTVGVLKDVSEHWVTFGQNATIAKQRFHFQSAVFSATGYTSVAEEYAFAHDVYLIPLTSSQYIQHVIDLIHQVTSDLFESRTGNISVDLKELRQTFREAVRGQRDVFPSFFEGVIDVYSGSQILSRLVDETIQIQATALAMINNRFPVFLIPSPETNLEELLDWTRVRIRWDYNGWYLYSARDERKLFSFDLPPDLFERYAEQDLLTGRPRLSPQQALNLKEENLSEIQATVVVNERIRVLNFSLDQNWLRSVRRDLNRIRQRR